MLDVTSLYIAQMKQKHGIIEREYDHAPKAVSVREPQCPEGKKKVVEEAQDALG